MTSTSNVSLLAAGFSQILGTPVSTVEKLQEEGYGAEAIKNSSTVSLDQLFCLTHGIFAEQIIEVHAPGRNNSLFVKSIDGKVLTVEFNPCFTILQVKQLIELQTEIPPDEQRLIYCGRTVEDERTLSDYNIQEQTTLHQVVRLRGGGLPLVLSQDLLAPSLDYDFTDMQDDGQVFMRGDYVYKRPYGWKRLAVNVQGLYEDDVWLGKPGFRTRSSHGEWPVSYHGTRITHANSIIKEGYKDDCLKRQLHGKGHYSSPDVSVAEQFAVSYTHEKDNYKMVLQNRINMSGTIVIPQEATKNVGEYYVTQHRHDLRPYGILIKKI